VLWVGGDSEAGPHVVGCLYDFPGPALEAGGDELPVCCGGQMEAENAAACEKLLKARELRRRWVYEPVQPQEPALCLQVLGGIGSVVRRPCRRESTAVLSDPCVYALCKQCTR
jgi:hypothetical protein